MAIAYIQEFAIRDGDTSTANYDAVVAALDLQDAPDGLIVHTAGFDLDAGVFRIFDVWESRAQGQRFMDERLNPVIEPMMAGWERRFRAPHARRLVRAARRASGLRAASSSEHTALRQPHRGTRPPRLP